MSARKRFVLVGGKARALKANEHQEQAAFFDWWREFAPLHGIPEHLCFAIKNDSKHSDAGRIYRWKEGVQAGVSDVFMAIPAGGFHGLFMEFKAVGGDQPTEKQERFLADAAFVRYRAIPVYGADEAIRAANAYLKACAIRWRPVNSIPGGPAVPMPSP